MNCAGRTERGGGARWSKRAVPRFAAVRLAAELRQLREAKGRSGESVANALRWSPSKISRYERAKTGLRPKEVERLLDYYGVGGTRREMLLALAQDASQKGWWEEYAESLPEDYQQFIGLEHEATAVAIWHVDVVAGLLQTEGYARHIIDSYDRVEPIAPSQVTRLVRVRMRRQQVLDRAALKISVVLDESVLLRRIGSDLTMYEQMQRLAKECERPNLTLQILPLDGPAHGHRRVVRPVRLRGRRRRGPPGRGVHRADAQRLHPRGRTRDPPAPGGVPHPHRGGAQPRPTPSS